jgi:hypothetical protein
MYQPIASDDSQYVAQAHGKVCTLLSALDFAGDLVPHLALH